MTDDWMYLQDTCDRISRISEKKPNFWHPY